MLSEHRVLPRSPFLILSGVLNLVSLTNALYEHVSLSLARIMTAAVSAAAKKRRDKEIGGAKTLN